MIERYQRKEMRDIWSDKARFDTWLEIEIKVCEALAGIGEIPNDALQIIKLKAAYDIKRVGEIEDIVHHDVIAFLTAVAEKVGPESRYIHLGMTSSDLLDTSFALLLVRSSGLIESGLMNLLAVMKRRAFEFKTTLQMGRSHGMFAEPITFGFKIAIWYAEFLRQLERFRHAVGDISYGKISGAVGTFAHIDPRVEEYVCKALSLERAPVSSQIIQRDRYAHYFGILAGIASSIEKVAVEIRNLQRSEVGEVAEPFGRSQKGSSAMPHKRNPILCENLTGLARVVRANAMAAFENVALWHERDISHSSVERIIAPDTVSLVDFMIARLTKVIDGMEVYPERMMENINNSLGLYNSQDVMLALVKKGMAREEAYGIVQEIAMRASKERKQFSKLLTLDSRIIGRLTEGALGEIFDLASHTKHIDKIFARVFRSEVP